MSNIKKAVLQALIEGVLTELMVKTTGEQVFISDNVTLSAKLSEIVTAVNLRAKSTDVTAEITAAVTALKNEIMGDGVNTAYDTFTEFAAYVAEHKDVADALQAAIGSKADAATVEAIKATVDALGSLARKNTVSESDLDAALKEKVNAASEGNHSHNNKDVLDDIKATDVENWNGKGKAYFSTNQPANLTSNDLWVQIVE